MNAIIERDSLESINPQNATAFFLENLRRVQDGQPDLGILRAEWLPIEFDDEQE